MSQSYNIAATGQGPAVLAGLALWDSSENYDIDDEVIIDDGGTLRIFTALTSNTNTNPLSNPGDWKEVSPASADGNGIYDGNGSLSGDTTVTQAGNQMTWSMNDAPDSASLIWSVDSFSYTRNGESFSLDGLSGFIVTGSFGTAFQVNPSTGKVTIPGLLDPTGLQMTPAGSNPGDAQTLWSNSGDSNDPYWGGNAMAFISDTFYQTNGTLSSTRTVTLGANDLIFDTSGGKVHVDGDDITVNGTVFQVSSGGGASRENAILVERTGAQSDITFHDAGNWGQMMGVNYRHEWLSGQFDGTTFGTSKSVFAYHTSGSEYQMYIGKTLGTSLAHGIDLDKALRTQNSSHSGIKITRSGTAVFNDTGNSHTSYGLQIADTGNYQQQGTGNSTKIGIEVNVSGAVSSGVAAINRAIHVIAGVSYFEDDIEIAGGTDGIIMEDTTLGTRHRITLDNGSLTVSGAL